MTEKSIIKNNPFSMEHGKLPPQDVEMEETLLGAVMLEKDALPKIAEYFSPSLFYKEAHALIAEAIINLSAKNHPIDIMTVVTELKRMKHLDLIGGPYYVTTLTNRVSSAANIEYWCMILVQLEIKRKLILYGGELVRDSYDSSSDAINLIEQAEKGLTEASKKTHTGTGTKTMAQLVTDTRERNKAMLDKKGVTGIPTGFVDLDKITGGWQQSDLIILAARPGMGKTSAALQLARNATKAGKRAGVISLEMSARQLMYRLQSQETEIPLYKLRTIGLSEREQEELESLCKDLIDSGIYIDDTPAQSMIQIKTIARKWFREHKIEILFIDYLQLIEADNNQKNGNRTNEVDYISRNLKALAKELDIPVIALSQLSRAVETRGGAKRPQLSDLRESGSIEQDADLVVFLYRPEYYGITEDDNKNSTVGLAKWIIDKHRNGDTGDVTTRWNGVYTKFYNFDKPMNTHQFSPNQTFESKRTHDDDVAPF